MSIRASILTSIRFERLSIIRREQRHVAAPSSAEPTEPAEPAVQPQPLTTETAHHGGTARHAPSP